MNQLKPESRHHPPRSTRIGSRITSRHRSRLDSRGRRQLRLRFAGLPLFRARLMNDRSWTPTRYSADAVGIAGENREYPSPWKSAPTRRPPEAEEARSTTHTCHNVYSRTSTDEWDQMVKWAGQQDRKGTRSYPLDPKSVGRNESNDARVVGKAMLHPSDNLNSQLDVERCIPDRRPRHASSQRRIRSKPNLASRSLTTSDGFSDGWTSTSSRYSV